MDKELDHMISRFPQFRGLAMQLFTTNDAFKTVCEDYWQCSTDMQSIVSEQLDDHHLTNQYTLLRLELETEALRMLTHFKNQQLPG